MKNTMKKLLSLVLVAMLLVSAIPFQAAAVDDGSKSLTVKIYVNDEWVRDASVPVGTDGIALTSELAQSLVKSDKVFDKWTGASGNTVKEGYTLQYAGITEEYYVCAYYTKGTSEEPEEDTRVAKKVPVEIYVDNSYVRDGEITVPVDGSVTLTKELGESLVKTDKVFDKWVGYYSDGNATGARVSYENITDDYFLKLYVTTKKEAPETPETVEPITVKIVDANGNAIAKEFQVTPVNGKSSVVGDILTQRWMGDWKDSYEFVTAKSDEQGKKLTLSSVINAGDTLTITLKAKTTSDNTDSSDTHTVTFYDYYGDFAFEVEVKDGKKISTDDLKTAQKKVGTVDGRVFGGWQIDDEGTVYSNTELAKRSIKHDYDFYAYFTTRTNKFPYDVYLNIYKDTKVGSPDKQIKITNGIAKDGRITLEEVKDVVEDYYTAKTSRGITYDGLYLAEGNWVADYVADTKKYDVIEAKEMVQNGNVFINVMIGNANAKSTEKADSSNPKTGDMIFVPVIFMLVSGAAIAGVCIYNKKRSAR
ncbi:MAG: hypothetical protein ACI3V5_10055 [Faecousia sp.]